MATDDRKALTMCVMINRILGAQFFAKDIVRKNKARSKIDFVRMALHLRKHRLYAKIKIKMINIFF